MRVCLLVGWLGGVLALGNSVVAQSPGTVRETAEQVLVRAHRARAQWRNFPGFEAEVTLQSNGRHAVRRVVVTPSLDVQWTPTVPPEFAALQRRFESIIQHRKAREEYRFDAEFVAEKGEHPLGRLIRFRNDPMHSLYRVQGDLITQVSRDAGPLHFTISVLDVIHNAQGKYLPRVYTVSFWNRNSGHLVRSFTVKLQWRRLGRWDLPATIHSVTTQGESAHLTEVIQVRNHRLLSSSPAARSGTP